MAKKDPIVKQYGGIGGYEDGSYTVFDSRTAKYGNKSNAETSAGAQKSAKILNQLKKDAAVVKETMGIWQGVTTAYGFNNHGQHSIEGLQKLQNLAEGSHVIIYDFETLGVAPHMKGSMEFYTPTEIGLRKAVMKNGKLELLDDKLSILTQPVPKVQKALNQLVNNVTGNPWVGANPDVARTLSDLVLYSGNKKTHFDESGNLVSVKNQNRTDLPLKGTVISSAKNTGLMKNGLDRLIAGTPPAEIAKQLNAFMAGTVNPMFVAFNNYNFDQPLGMDYFGNQLMGALKNDEVSKKYLQDFMNAFGGHQVDLLHAERTIRRNMYERHGNSNTLERQADVFGFEQETAHHALSDAGATVQKANQMLQDTNILNYLNTGGTPGSNMGRFNSTELMAGDRLFARAGMGSNNAGAFDGVFRINNKGQYVPINDLKANPIYKSATYEIKRWLDGVEIDGKKQFGVELYNETDDLHHVIYRNTKAELQDVIHGHMDYVDKVTKGHVKDLETTNRDRGLRRWNKMFSTESGGGDNLVRRMMGALDLAQNIESQWDEYTNEAKLVAKGHSWEEAAKIAEKNRGRVQRIVNRGIGRQNEWNNESFVRDFNTMRGRLEGEADWIKGFMNHLDGSQYGKTDSNYMRRVRNQAWSEFGNVMTSMFGANESAKSLGHNTVGINLRISGNDELLRLNDVDSVRGNMYSMLYRDHAGKPNISKMKQRYRELLGELKAKNALAAKEFEYYYKEFDKVKYDPKNANYPIDNLLNDLANTVMKARETNSINGAVKSIKTEDPTRVMGTSVSGRKRKMEKNLSHADNIFNHVMQRVTPFATHWESDGKSPIPLRGKALDIIEAHKQGIENMLNRTGIMGNPDIQINTANLSDPTAGLKNLAKSYMDQGMHVKIVHDGKRDALSLVLADRETPASALDGSLKDIMGGRYKHNVAIVPLPKITKDSQLQLGGQNRVARFIATRENGGYGIQTGYDEILRTLAVNAPYARRILNDAKAMGEGTGILQMESILNSRGKGAMQNLSMNYRNMNPNDVEQMFNIRSSAANWVRGGAIDLSVVAEDWYEQHYNKTDAERRKLWGMKTPEEIAKKARSNYELFVNTMDINSRRVFQREVDSFWNERTGMDVGMHSIKDTHASNYLRASVDIRELYGFGFDNPMARENMQKTVNYLALDKSRVVANLIKAGYSTEDIERMTKMGVTTDRAKQVFEDYQAGSDKVSFMNLRTAYMDDATLKARVQSAIESFEADALIAPNATEKAKLQSYADMLRKNPEALSVYDGMFLISNEASQAFETPRTKTIKIGKDAVLTPEMKRAMEVGVQGDVDWSKSFTLDSRITMDDVLTRQSNKKGGSGRSVTVSQIVKSDLIYNEDGEFATKKNGQYREHISRTPDAVYDKWHMKDSRIVGWHVDEEGNRAIEVEEMSRSMQGMKFNTTSGGRLTGNQSLPQAVIERVAGMEGVHAIAPSMEPGKKLWGTVLNEYVSLAVDEAVKQTQGDKLTVGGLKKQEALEQVKQLMITNFGIDTGDVKVLNGELELNKRLRVGASALDITNIHGFIQGIGGVLGNDFADKMNGLQVDGAGAVRYANTGFGKADVYDWENGIGFIDKSHRGLVTYGWKEVDMVTTRANQKLSGENAAAVTGWLEGHIRATAEAQTNGIADIGSGLYRTVTDRRDYVPDRGDVVIKTTGSAFGVKDPLGRETGRITDNGVHEISMHAFNPLPKVTARNTLPIAEDYAGTILDFGRAKGHFGDENGPSFGDAIKANNGTALLEMPETGPGSGFIRDHVRLVDFGDVTKNGTASNPILREIQKTQQQLWRNIQLYQNLGKNEELTAEQAATKAAEVKGRINDLIVEYEDKAARMFTNARDGGFHKMFQSADMSMAGRFRIQGVNPMENYTKVDGEWKQTGAYQEGSVYMSRDRLKEMITGDKGQATAATENIAKAMGIMEDGLEGDALVNKVLDNVNDKGLYGLVNRYPTIKQSTVQAMRFRIDDAIDPSDRTARLTVGTAQRLKADYDGDFMSAVLAHYGTDKAESVHKGLAELAEYERQDSIVAGAKAAADVHGDITNIAKQYNMTVSDIVKEFDIAKALNPAERDKKQASIVSAFTINNRKTMMDMLETQEARLGKEMVGFVDNTRYKVDTYMGYVTDLLQQHGKIEAEQAASARNIVQDVMAAFSQDSISAKKFDYDKAFERISAANPNADQATLKRLTNEDITNRYVNLLDMDAAIKNLTPENRQRFIDANEIVGVYEGDESKTKMLTALDTLQEYQKYGAKVGGVNNMSLKVPVSEGLNADQARAFWNGNGSAMYGIDSVKAVMDVAPNDEVRTMIQNRINRTENSILQTYDDIQNTPQASLVDSLGTRAFNADDHVLSGATAADRASSGLGAMVSKFTPKMMHSPSFGGGAVAFGAMWAASALIRSGPTPEGLQEQTQTPGPPAPNLTQQVAPTARISENNGEYVNIRVNAKAAAGMSEQDVAAIVHQELGNMTSMKLDTTLNVNDNTQQIDTQWLQGVVANAINKGFAF